MSGYPFERGELGPFWVHVSRVQPGMQHLKRFALDTRPDEQKTLNLYVRGRFKVTCAGAEQIYEAGSSSLGWPGVYPAGEIVVEEPLEAGVRVCVQPKEERGWARERLDLRPGERVQGWLLVLEERRISLLEEYTAQGAGEIVWRLALV